MREGSSLSLSYTVIVWKQSHLQVSIFGVDGRWPWKRPYEDD